MIISHSRRFIFVKTRKTAGTSVEIMLSEFCGPGDVITPTTAVDDALRRDAGFPGPQNCDIPRRFYRAKDWGRLLIRRRQPDPFENHQPASRIRHYVGERIWRDYYSFCIERNPWDKVISAYHYAPRTMSLHDFIMTERVKAVSHWEYYTRSNRVIVDHVVRFENLRAELQNVCVRLGLPSDRTLPRAKGGFRKDRRPYWEVLSEEERDRIADVFHREIEHFGYTFLPQTDDSAGEIFVGQTA